MKHTVTEKVLGNGARGLVVDVPGSSVVNLEVHFNSGFQFAQRRIYELPHVLEHLIGCGSKRYPGPNAFKVEVQKNGAFRNAFTTVETNGYVLEFADFELERMLELLEQWLVEPVFPEEAFATEVSNVREELNRLRGDHDATCAFNLGARCFPQRSMAVGEHIEQLPDITLADVKRYYKRTHTSANARFYVAGDVAAMPVEVVARLERILGRLPRGERLVPDASMGLGVERPILERREIPSIHYRLGSFAGGLDQAERNAMMLARMVLFNGFSSRIYGEARRRGLAYHIAAASSASQEASMLGVNGFVTAANIEPLFELVATEYRRLREGELDEVELAAARDRLIGSSLRSYQTAADMLSWYMGRYDAEEGIYGLEEQLSDLRKVKVNDVVRVVGKMVGEGRQALSLVGDVDERAAEGYLAKLRPMWAT